MHVLFVHSNFPAQFGHVAANLIRQHGWRCTFVSRKPASEVAGIRLIHYEPVGGATESTHFFARSFENAVAHAHGVFEACRRHPDLRPDLVVGHSGFGSTLFLPELYRCPLINYFEYYYHPHGSDLDFRPEFAATEMETLRSYCRNATLLLDLQNCRAGYAPTCWQRDRLPEAYRGKVEVIFDGVDLALWHRRPGAPRQVGTRVLGPGTRLVTYVSRGFESMRGFDVFMRVAKRIYTAMPDVVFAVVGEDRVVYGGDLRHTGGRSFKDHVLAQDDYDLSKFVFTGYLPPDGLAKLLSASDLHVYLTVPFVLSWSLFNALACGCTVVASDVGPVRELIEHGRTGLLANFHDADGLAGHALDVLRDPGRYRALGEAGAALIRDRYSLEKTLPRTVELYRRVAAGGTARPSGTPGAEDG